MIVFFFFYDFCEMIDCVCLFIVVQFIEYFFKFLGFVFVREVCYVWVVVGQFCISDGV